MYLDILHVFTQSFQSKQQSQTSFCIIICFLDVGSPCAFVCEIFSITRINQEFLIAIVIALDLFRSCLFTSRLTFRLFGLRNHQRWGKSLHVRSCFLCTYIMPFKNKTLLFSIVYIFLK